MAKGKYVAKSSRKFNGKLGVFIAALVLAFSGVVGGTIAWLIDTPDPVVNTFTYGDINITLTETDTRLDEDNDPNTNSYKMLPGAAITKDPVVTVKTGSEDMYLFVKLEKSQNFDTFMEYAIADGWTALSGVDGVYYREVPAATVANADVAYDVLANNTVTVKESVTKEQLNSLDASGTASYPTLTVTAYAVQTAGNATSADAWAKIPANP